MSKNVIIYHGSQQILKEPAWPFAKKPYYDFGQGFYCTASRDLAMEWACPVKRDGFINKYELKTDDLKVLDLTKQPYTLLNWLALLLRSRKFDLRSDINSKARVYLLSNFMPLISDSDALIGWRADDSFFTLAEEFFNDSISLRQLAEAVCRSEENKQIVLLTEKAHQALTFKGYETADCRRSYYMRTERDEAMLADFENNRNVSPALPAADIYILDIVREVMRNDDPRLQTNLSE